MEIRFFVLRGWRAMGSCVVHLNAHKMKVCVRACVCANFTQLLWKLSYTCCNIARYSNRLINQVARPCRRWRRRSIKYSHLSGVRCIINFNLLGKSIHFLAHHFVSLNRKMDKITFDASNLIKRAWQMASDDGTHCWVKKPNKTKHPIKNAHK